MGARVKRGHSSSHRRGTKQETEPVGVARRLPRPLNGENPAPNAGVLLGTVDSKCKHAMVTATFRFYGGLNSFLPRARRQRDFDVMCARAATTKHMIEALGVPHTEVELVLVNGGAARFDHLLKCGDRVAVYPKFESLDITQPLRLYEPSPCVRRFIADAHLGGLARLLRMAGFDTLYDNHADDGVLAALAEKEVRTLLTRDRELLKRRNVAHGCYVRALKSSLQLKEIFERLDLAGSAHPFTRCLKCNALLRTVDKALVEERLPPNVRAHSHRFSTCDLCQRVFWDGSHWRSMQALLAKLMEGCEPSE